MEQTAVDAEEITTLESAVLEQQGSGTAAIPSTAHRQRIRTLSLLGSFPSRVFCMAALFYIALTGLHLWLQGASAASLAGWGSQITASWRHFDTAFFLQRQ